MYFPWGSRAELRGGGSSNLDPRLSVLYLFCLVALEKWDISPNLQDKIQLISVLNKTTLFYLRVTIVNRYKY